MHVQDGKGNTVLHLAAKSGNVELFMLLIDKGADIYKQNKIGSS